MDGEKALYFFTFFILLVISIHCGQYYNSVKEAFEEESLISKFLTNEQVFIQTQSFEDEVLFLNAMNNLKKVITQRLCVIKNIVESSISVSQISLPETEKDQIYDVNVDGGGIDIGGTYIDEPSTLPENKICNYKKWLPDEIKKKDSIVGYTGRLVRYYNKRVIELNKNKIVLSEFIDEFQRLLIENLDERLLGRCDVCTTEDCNNVLCVNTKDNLSSRLTNSKILLINKIEKLQVMLCEFSNLYKHMGDVQSVILAYTNELQTMMTIKKNNIASHMTLNLLDEYTFPLSSSKGLAQGVNANNNVALAGQVTNNYLQAAQILRSQPVQPKPTFTGLAPNLNVMRID